MTDVSGPLVTRAGYLWAYWDGLQLQYSEPGPMEIEDFDQEDLARNIHGIDWQATASLQMERAEFSETEPSPQASPQASQVLTHEDIRQLLDWNPPRLHARDRLHHQRLWRRYLRYGNAMDRCQSWSPFNTLRSDLSGSLKHVLHGESWRYWRAWLHAVLGQPLTFQEFIDFFELTGRIAPPGPIKEAWAVAGRRSGKTFAHSVLAVWLAAQRYTLAPGEKALIGLVSYSREQADQIHDYCLGIVEESPELSELVESSKAGQIDFVTGTRIRVQTASFRGLRGYSMVAMIADELAFWRDSKTYANPADEILAAVGPALGNLNGWLLCCTSPFARQGVVYDAVEQNYANSDSDICVLRAPTHVLNETFSREYIEKKFRANPNKARAEWLGEFRGDLESYIPMELVDQAVDNLESRPYDSGISYYGFLDASNGVRDSMTLGIAHREGDYVVLDHTLEVVPPFDPAEVTAYFAKALRSYGLYEATADRVGGAWVASMFEEHGITVKQDALPKSTIYGELLPLLSAGKVRLTNNPTLRKQILALESRAKPGGGEAIDHPPGGHDDVVNAAAGALILAMGETEGYASWLG